MVLLQVSYEYLCSSPSPGCPECSSACCSAPNKTRLPPPTNFCHLKSSSICSRVPSSLSDTDCELGKYRQDTKKTKRETAEMLFSFCFCVDPMKEHDEVKERSITKQVKSNESTLITLHG